MIVVVLERHVVTNIYNSILTKKTFLGNVLDVATTTKNPTIPEWDASVAYPLGTWAKIENLKMKYVSGGVIAGIYPPASTDWEGTTLDGFEYQDNSPTRQSFAGGEIIFDLNFSIASDSLVVQNMDGVERILVEAVAEDGSTIRALNGEDGVELWEVLSHSCYNCCETLVELNKHYVLEDIAHCGEYSKLRVTLFANAEAIAEVGTVAVGKAIDIGCLMDYPKFTGMTTSVYKEVNTELDLIEGHTFYEASNITTLLRGELFAKRKGIIAEIGKNIGRICYFHMPEFPEEDITKILGYIKPVEFSPPKGNLVEIGLKIHGLQTN